MFEIKENRRVLPDGTEITTYSRDVISATSSKWKQAPPDIKAATPVMADVPIFVLPTQPAPTFRCIPSVAMPMRVLK